MLDRFDLSIFMTSPSLIPVYQNRTTEESSASILARVLKARDVQAARYAHHPHMLNATMGVEEIKAFGQLSHEGFSVLHALSDQFHLSARGTNRILKISRTIADLDGSDAVTLSHLHEALQYRLDVNPGY
jgi:magnesium chelatase family protein